MRKLILLCLLAGCCENECRAQIVRLTVSDESGEIGPAKAARIAQQCGIPPGSTAAIFKHKWFAQCEHGVDLTPEAYKV